MRRNSVIAAFALALTVGTASAASAQVARGAERPHDMQHDSARYGPGVRHGRHGLGKRLLRGITLSADQKAQLKTLHERRHQEWEAERAKLQGQARPERQRGDTTGLGVFRAQMQQRHEQQLAEIRNILTPEQRVQFDKNVAEMKAHAAQRGEGRGRGFGRESSEAR